MSNARDNILARLSAVDVAMPTTPPDRADYALHDWDSDEKIKRFSDRMVAVRAEVMETSCEDWVAALQALCFKKGINNLLLDSQSRWGAAIEQSASAGGDWPQRIGYADEIESWKEALFYQTDASLTSTLGGIAETGSIILWPTVEEPRLMSLVPPIHFAILEADKLYSTFAEAMREQNWAAGMPTNALLISGPSKSADIEQTLAYGVHGPKELIVLLIR